MGWNRFLGNSSLFSLKSLSFCRDPIDRVLREEHATLQALVAELLPLKEQVAQLSLQVKQLESRLAKDSHNSHLPPSSDRFARQKKSKSLRKKSDKKPGAQAGHDGNTLFQVQVPDQI